jgi:UDP-N-acetylmuramoyl-tripeptide--D-alanyl-D-alanine ligase
MRDWDAKRVARAAGARLVFRPDAEASPGGVGEGAPSGPVRVSIDSRAVAPGDLFVGLRGASADGGEYAAQALQAGAWGVLVAPEHALAVAAMAEAAGADAGIGYRGVVLADPNPLAGLQSLARSWLAELRSVAGARVVAITGSTGKTSTKDILAALLAPHLRTVASPANFNTEIGLPLAILAAPADTEALVLEMAMRGPGQIAELTAIAEPEVGVIVNVGPVHLELLGSLEAIAAAKAELIAGLTAGATAIVPAGEPLLGEHLREDITTITFGPGGDIQLADRSPAGSVCILDGTSIGRSANPGTAIDTPGGSPPEERDRGGAPPADATHILLRPSFSQTHNLRNLLAAVAAARALGVTPDGEVTVRFSALRGERIPLSEEIVLIDDCYNANPMSMRCAIDDLAQSAPGRRVAVLGDMLELGSDERRFHREIGAHAAARGVDVLVTVGPLAAEMAPAFADADTHAGAETRPSADARSLADTHTGAETRPSADTHSVADAPAAAELLEGLLSPGDTVLVKGSRGVGLERVGQALLAREAHDGVGRDDVPRHDVRASPGDSPADGR